ncbi:hypothetical protein DSO57_1016094 [Entomophthora muscae]|uniref:Uncharacterized protein n=1 Tax=Entomophthora muscae TaxID=34485 RepID=A0ACC2RW65_9FUNG|nr:hypothetical protein DSO57_1016094 [Entomophthora muscae]
MSASLYYLSSHQCSENCASKTNTCLGLPNLCQEQTPQKCFDGLDSFESAVASEGSFEMLHEPSQFSSIPMSRTSKGYPRLSLAARIEAAKERYRNPSLLMARPLLN